jgi:hypothetical protein
MCSVEVERAILRRRIPSETCRVVVRPSDEVYAVVKLESYSGTNGD